MATPTLYLAAASPIVDAAPFIVYYSRFGNDAGRYITGLSLEYVEGYVEGIYFAHAPTIQVRNGLPKRLRRDLKKFNPQPIDQQTLERILEDTQIQVFLRQVGLEP